MSVRAYANCRTGNCVLSLRQAYFELLDFNETISFLSGRESLSEVVGKV